MEILEATPEEFDEIVALFKSYRFALQERSWYDWKYFGNPAGDARPFKITAGGKIVGAVAVIPQWFTWQGRRIMGVQTVDGLLGREVRGKGNFNRLMHFLATRKPPGFQDACFYLSFPSLAASVKAHQNAGWHKLASFSLVSYPLTPEVLFRKKPRPGLQKVLDIPWSAYRRLLFGRSRSTVAISPADGASPDFNELTDPGKVSGERSAAFMKWRVDENPRDHIHTLLIHEEGRFAGYAVCKRVGATVEVTEIRLKKPGKAHIRALLKYLDAHKLGTSVNFWCFGEGAIKRALPKIGVFRRTFSGALFVNNLAAIGLPADANAWDITYLDSDW